MTRAVSFNGITRYTPGGISRVRTDTLATTGTSVLSVGLIGESTGGEPGATAGLVSVKSPANAKTLFRSGPLVDAIIQAFQSSADLLVPGGAGEVVVYKTNASTQSSVHIPIDGSNAVPANTAAAGSSTVLVNLTTGGLTVDALIGYKVDITLAALPGSPVYRRTIASNTANSLTVTPALPTAPVATNPVNVRSTAFIVSSRDYGAHTANTTVDYTYTDPSASSNGGFQVTVGLDGNQQISPTLGETPRLKLTYIGGANAVAVDTLASVTTATNTALTLTTGGLTIAAHALASVVITDPVSGLSEQVRITTNAAGTLTLQAPGISNELLAAIKLAGNGVATVAIKTVTNATATINGANGVATSLTTSITGVSGDNLSITFPSGMTVADLANLINKNINYSATVPNSINGNLQFAANFDYSSTAYNIQIDPDVRATTGATYEAQRAFYADIFDILTWFNAESKDAVAARHTAFATDGSFLALDSLTGEYTLSGGIRGISANSNFQAGLDLMLTRQVSYVVPLIDRDLSLEGNTSTATWASVAQQLRDHVTVARGRAGLERGAFIGFRGTKAQYIAACNSLNDTDIQVVSQYPTLLNSESNLEQFGPSIFAVQAASMRAGVGEPGEPLTNKYIRVNSLTQDASWNPADVTDSADLILNGGLFAVEVPGKGFRWVRDLTSYIKDDNICWTEGSVRDLVRRFVYGLRTQIENKFTGRKGTPTTIGAVRDFAVSVCEAYRTAEYIVDSTDPVTGEVVRAYYGLSIIAVGDVLSLSVGIFPCPGINFQLSDIFIAVPTQAA